MPTPDEIDRDRFYSPDADDDGADYELEPPDAEVLAAEERRAREAIEETKMSIDIDEIYREADRERGGEILESWLRNFHFRFQVKHLLIGTAVLAIILTLAKLEMLGTTLVILTMLSVAGLYLYLQWQEKKHRDEAERRLRQMYARRRAHLKKSKGEASDDDDLELDDDSPQAPAPLPNEVDAAWQEAMSREKFRFQFSLRQLLATMVIAALILGMAQFMGSPANAAILLGVVALAGLVIHAAGVEPPEIMVLGWWLVLVMYVVVSIVAAVWSGFA